MSYQKIPLLAGVPFRLDIPGKLLLIDSVGVASGVDVALIEGGADRAPMMDRKPGFRLVNRFDGVILTASVNTTVALFLAMEDVNLGTNQLEISNSASNPVNVLFAGTVAPVLGNITNNNAAAIPVQKQQLATLSHPAAVSVGVAAVVVSNDATLKRLRIRNNHPSARVCLGGATVTVANAAIVLEPGDVWDESDAAGAAWYAVSDTAATDVRVMGVK